jgi:hypothetical protein
MVRGAQGREPGAPLGAKALQAARSAGELTQAPAAAVAREDRDGVAVFGGDVNEALVRAEHHAPRAVETAAAGATTQRLPANAAGLSP